MSLSVAEPVVAQEPPSYSKQVGPFFVKYCVECHNEKKPRAGLNLETYEALKEGSDYGDVVVPGKADESKLVLLLEGIEKPKMPPEKSARQPKKTEIELVRAWVSAGAKLDKTAAKTVLPAVKAKVKVWSPITALVYLPEGDRLLAGMYGGVAILDAIKHLPVGIIKSEQRITALACSPDGKRLAVAEGLPGSPAQIKLFEVPASQQSWSKPLVVPAAHADVIQDMAFSPDGRQLISVGYDRLVKIWDAHEGTPLHTRKEHSDSVFGVSFRPDGKLFATAGADRSVKVWDAASAKLLYTLGEATDWLYTVTFSPDGEYLAAAGVDKSIRVWRVSSEKGDVVHSVFAHPAPVVKLAYSPDGKTLFSLSEDHTVKAWDAKRMVERLVVPKQSEAVLSLAVNPEAKQLALGRFDGALLLYHPETGTQLAKPLPAADASLPTVQLTQRETENNNSPATGQTVTLPAHIEGAVAKTGDVDFYRFEARAGQELGVKVEAAAVKGKPVMNALLQLCDDGGKVLARSDDDRLGYKFTQSGWYSIGVRDVNFRGGGNMTYKLHLGDFPVVTAIFPLGLQKGTEKTIRIAGVNLDGLERLSVKAKANAAPGSKIPVDIPNKNGKLPEPMHLIVGEFAEIDERPGKILEVPVPGTVNGIIRMESENDLWRFEAEKGKPLIIEVNARRLGSALDSTIEILDQEKELLARATLRSLAKTYVTFRDHNSVQPNIRIEAWSELSVNDFIYTGTELLKIKALPTHPDSDCNFFSRKGKRVGYLDTTPTFLPKGEPMYKVAVYPPGTSFAPNGFPVVTLFYRNDDGGADFGRDSRLTFDAPSDGYYFIRIRDSRGQGGENFAYRLTVRPPRPSFSVRFSPANPSVWKGGAIPITVTADRFDGYNGPIKVRLENLPNGLSAPPSTILPDMENTTLALAAEAEAAIPKKTQPIKLVAEAVIDGKTIRKEVQGGKAKVVKPGDIVTTTKQKAVSIRPGGQSKLTFQIERRNGFKGRVPISVQGLPHGVKVLDIGLNGILITEKETRRTIVFYCEPWVEPVEHPIVITARREGKNTQHSAPSVLLKIVNK